MTWINKKFKTFYAVLSNRNALIFGLLLSGVLFAGFWFSVSGFRWLYFVFSVLQVLGFVFQRFFRFEYALLSLLFLPVGMAVSTLVLAIAYYLILVPLSLFRKRKYSEGWLDSVTNIDPQKMYE